MYYEYCIKKMTNTTATSVTKYCHSKKVRYKIDFSILHTVLLAIILILTIIIICYQSKEKRH